jgi:hypothetical protein
MTTSGGLTSIKYARCKLAMVIANSALLLLSNPFIKKTITNNISGKLISSIFPPSQKKSHTSNRFGLVESGAELQKTILKTDLFPPSRTTVKSPTIRGKRLFIRIK